MNRRDFLKCGALAAATVGVVGKANAIEATQKKGGSYIASCPGAKHLLKTRRPGPMRVMYIGAHPDDDDIRCGCLALRQIDAGAEVVFVSLTNGCNGHHKLNHAETARVRKAESQEAKKRFGLKDYLVLDTDDCALQVTYEGRTKVAKMIRKFQPDFVVTHRTCDYHVDHRNTGTLVMDAGYLLGVPHWVEEEPAQRLRPVILYMTDPFTYPRELRPDVMVAGDAFMDRWCEGLDAQVSQFYEWLPWDRGDERVPDRKDIKARNEFLVAHHSWFKTYDAKRFAGQWKAKYPMQSVPKFLEAFEVSEYGRGPTPDDLKAFACEA